MTSVFLGLGSNIGNRQKTIEQAIEKLEKEIGRVEKKSALYESAAWGFESRHRFLNAVIQLSTALEPELVWQKIREIELGQGKTARAKGQAYADRKIDIDILYFGNLILKSDELTVPHPEIHKRRFVLEPLHEIAPEFKDPENGSKISELLTFCKDTSLIRQIRNKQI